jgi:hypothetical protein
MVDPPWMKVPWVGFASLSPHFFDFFRRRSAVWARGQPELVLVCPPILP